MQREELPNGRNNSCVLHEAEEVCPSFPRVSVTTWLTFASVSNATGHKSQNACDIQMLSSLTRKCKINRTESSSTRFVPLWPPKSALANLSCAQQLTKLSSHGATAIEVRLHLVDNNIINAPCLVYGQACIDTDERSQPCRSHNTRENSNL